MTSPLKPLRPWPLLIGSTLIALVATALLYAGASAIPGLTRQLFAGHFAERVTMDTIPGFLERRERLNEVRTFLDQRIAEHSIHDMVYAYRGRLDAIVLGPEAGFRKLASLIETHPLLEQTGQWVELARLAGLAGRWDDFYAIALLLNDYGQAGSVASLLKELQAAGKPASQALLTPAGIRFMAASAPDDAPVPAFEEGQKDLKSLYLLWRAHRQWRDEEEITDSATTKTLALALPNDPRQKALLLDLSKSKRNHALVATTVLPAPPLLRGSNFISHGKPVREGRLLGNGTYEGRFAKPAMGPLWLLCSATPVLHVYPMVFVELDDQFSIHYLPDPLLFPEFLTLPGQQPVHSIRIHFVNDLSSKPLEQDRNIQVAGIWSVNGS